METEGYPLRGPSIKLKMAQKHIEITRDLGAAENGIVIFFALTVVGIYLPA